jgi:prepilin-type N-terminal cleavage/methylation domain-containing protein
MPLLARRGFTLIELMIALVLLGIVSTAVYKVLVNNQRLYLAQTQTIDLQQNIRAAATILPAEFRELDAADSDIVAMTPTSITIRSLGKLAFICNAPVLGGGIGQVQFTVRATPIFGRNPTFAANDSLLVFWEGDPGTRSDDRWLAAQIKTVAAVPLCSDSGPAGAGTALHPGFTLTMQPQWINNGAVNIPGAITNGSPVRGFESVTYQVYQSPTDNNWYLGLQNNSKGASIQPLVGPLNGSNGLTLSYFDSVGAVTAVPTQVAQIDIVLRARTLSPVRGATGPQDYKVDSVTTRVALRNNPRCGTGSMPPSPCK